ncbi:hypothetical protein JCM8202_002927 [Rhodotorula sphaerocarpa]
MGWLRTVISTVWLLVAARIAVGRAYAAWTDRQRKRLAARLPSGSSETGTAKCVIGFFHPYCNAGGGGERVLWTALARMQLEKGTSAIFAVYTGDAGPGKASKEEILAKAQARFGIRIDPSTVAFVPLRHRWLVEDSTWPRLTLLGQSFGSIVLAAEGLFSTRGVVPDVWIDTMGYAFAYPLVRYVCRVPVASYTHYPTISTDMVGRVRDRRAGHTNSAAVARSRVLSSLKLAYYRLFAAAYTASLACADVLWVNSSWTRAHVQSLLLGGGKAGPASAASAQTRIRLLYPPCDARHLATFPLSSADRAGPDAEQVSIVSLAQFRPEKEHPTQLRAFAKLLASPTFASYPHRAKLRLVLAGSVRGAADAARVESLRDLASDLGVREQVDFRVNEPYEVVCELMRQATIGLHTMIDEHFGITVVEFQAAGLIPLAHASAGPLNDIVSPSGDVTDSTGFLAPRAASDTTTAAPQPAPTPPDLATEFAHQLEHILSLPLERQDEIRRNARANAVDKFGAEVFERGWMDGWREVERMASLPPPSSHDKKD